jgi:lysophospholipase L1-like esterase
MGIGIIHDVYDADSRFRINPITRMIQNESLRKTTLIQYDHNSEVFSFEIDRYVEGHDMSQCTSVEIHYNNISSATKEENKGLYEVQDMQISREDEEKVVFSWLISEQATYYEGKLAFAVKFKCETDGIVVYRWDSAINQEISVGKGIENSNEIAEKYADILMQWELELFGAEDSAIKNIESKGMSTMTEVTNHCNDTYASFNKDVSRKMGEMNQYASETLGKYIEDVDHVEPLEAQVSTLKARMDVFTKLEEGSTTGDAELQDIRVGADGVEYENAGTSVRTQFNNINSDLLATLSPYTIPLEIGAIMNNGSFNESTKHVRSPELTRKKCDFLYVDCEENDAVWVIEYGDIFDNKSGRLQTVVAYTLYDVSRTNYVHVFKPQSTYFHVCLAKSGRPVVTVEDFNVTFMYSTIYEQMLSSALNGYGAYMNAKTDELDGMSCVLDIPKNTVIAFNALNGRVTIDTFSGLPIYGRNLTLARFSHNSCSSGNPASGILDMFFAMYMDKDDVTPIFKYAFAKSSTELTDWYEIAKISDIPEIPEQVRLINGMNMFGRIGVISDSISVGWGLDKNGGRSRRNESVSWVQQMARHLGCTAYNLGASGVDPIEWFEPSYEFAEYCYTQYQNTEECDLYIIGLGLNQGTLGTIDDIEEDYTQNAKTFYGQYAKIIQMINAEHPNAVVMCLTEPTTAISNYDTAVRNICALDNINALLVDLETDYFDLFNTDEILAQRQPDNLHYTPLGYSLLANAMVTALNDFISKNTDKFIYVGIAEV